MNKVTNGMKLFGLMSLFIMLSGALYAQEGEVVGRIIRTTGDVQAQATTGTARALFRGDELFLQETILTGPESETQLRLSDGSMITITENAEFAVDEYVFDGIETTPDSLAMSIVKGSLRTISGTIGDEDGDTYSLNTPFASIGIRGTEYTVVVLESGRTLVTVYSGAIAFTPAGGGAPIILGVGSSGETDGVTTIELDALPAEIIEILVDELTDEEVQNLPPPGQVGNEAQQAAVAAAIQVAEEAGAVAVIPGGVSGGPEQGTPASPN